MFNRGNVMLVDTNGYAIERITERGVAEYVDVLGICDRDRKPPGLSAPPRVRPGR
jgi:hypothetical protein